MKMCSITYNVSDQCSGELFQSRYSLNLEKCIWHSLLTFLSPCIRKEWDIMSIICHFGQQMIAVRWKEAIFKSHFGSQSHSPKEFDSTLYRKKRYDWKTWHTCVAPNNLSDNGCPNVTINTTQQIIEASGAEEFYSRKTVENYWPKHEVHNSLLHFFDNLQYRCGLQIQES